MNMKIIDIVFALISGCAVGWVAKEFFAGYGIAGFWLDFSLLLGFSLLSLFCLWAAFLIGKLFLSIFQAAKHLLVGVIATVIDLKIFELLVWFFAQFFLVNTLLAKTISFIIATVAKYWGNKFWAFEHNGKGNILKEFFYFFALTIIGLVIDLSVFWYLTQAIGPLFAIPSEIWLKLSVIIAGASAAVWNFTAYKFLVFKK